MIIISILQYYASGRNALWQLGLGTDEKADVPTFIKNEATEKYKFKELSIAYYHALGIDYNGQLYGWSSNSYGKITNSSELYKYQAVPSGYFADKKITVKKVYAGLSFSFALVDGRTLFSFGNNQQGQLGRLTLGKNNDSTPALVDLTNLDSDETIESVSTSEDVSYLLTNKSKLYVWGKCQSQCPSPKNFWFMDENLDLYSSGDNSKGQLCNNVTNAFNYEPVKTGLKNITKIATSDSHTLILVNGEVYGCGRGDDGRLGGNFNEVRNIEPKNLLENGIIVRDIAASSYGSLILTNNQLIASGNGEYGELSLSDSMKNSTKFIPVQISIQPENIKNIYSQLIQSFFIEAQEEEEEIKREEEEIKKEEEQIKEEEIKEEEYIKPDQQLTSGQVAGIVIGTLIGAALLAIAIYFLVQFVMKNKRRNQEQDNQMINKQRQLNNLINTDQI